MPDFLATKEGVSFLLLPITPKARDWTRRNVLGPNIEWSGEPIVLSMHHILNLIEGLKLHGFEVEIEPEQVRAS